MRPPRKTGLSDNSGNKISNSNLLTYQIKSVGNKLNGQKENQ